MPVTKRGKTMDGFTVSNSNRWLESGGTRDSKSLSINDSSLTSPSAGGVGSTDSTQKSFSDTLRDAIGSVNELHKSADKAAQELATGKTDNVADVMIASEKADIALRLMVQVRNKIIDAYQEVMKMQV
jgi:flagellar hook-basal body complex protein FliE